jgi:glycosyltransferase involved in cell wall biosynthesis
MNALNNLTMADKSSGPLLSICVPTFNRSELLKSLLENVSKILSAFPSDIELCFSDNDSTDGTFELLNQFKIANPDNDIKIIRQKENIGLSNNVVDICCKASGKWIWVIGDDDGFDFENFCGALSTLKNLKGTPWIIVNSISGHNDYSTLDTHSQEFDNLSKLSSKFFLLKNGTVKIGFIGVHIIPRIAIDIFYKIPQQEYYMWPHLMIMDRFISEGGSILLLGFRPVIQSLGGKGALFWAARDFFKIEAQKAKISKYAMGHKPRACLFNCAMFLRQIYSAHSLAYLISWRLKEKDDFNSQFKIFKTEYLKNSNIIFLMFLLPLILLSMLLNVLPDKVLLGFLPTNFLKKMNSLHCKEESLSKDKNGLFRRL